jgi:3-hydroxymyristoyl/3-hydroxydecanoyl-(acyl carrier protein) dehydratase
VPAIERTCPVDHPAAQGHFPGYPIIPGAVMLCDTLQAIGAHLGMNLMPCRIRSAKFLHPTRPGDRVLIEFSGTPHGDLRFTCMVDGIPVLTANVECHARWTAA